MSWFIAVQVTICQALGYDFDATSFGAPPDENYRLPTSAGMAQTQAPCWSQHEVVEHRQQVPEQGQYRVKAPAAPMHEERPTTAARFEEAARIRARNSQGNVF